MRILELNNLKEKRRYLSLLLDADPSEEMVMRYLPRGKMFVLERDASAQAVLEGAAPSREEAILGEIVAVDLGDGRCEIKNLAVAPHAQRQGYGRLLVEHAAAYYAEACRDLLVGTSEQGVDFYKRCGFTYSHRAPGFFARNYPEPILENGKPCVDMLYLRRPL